MLRRSTRITPAQALANAEIARLAEESRVESYSYRECKTLDCGRPARHRGSLCEACYSSQLVIKTDVPILCQGCPQILAGQGYNDIRWSRDVRPATNGSNERKCYIVARWIQHHLELKISRPNNKVPPWIEVVGWKDSTESDELRVLSIRRENITDCS
jgi:hypothetical protein